MKKFKNTKTSRDGLEVLEDRRLLSSVAVTGGNLSLVGDANQSNAFLVRAASSNRVLGFSNNFGRVASLSSVQTVVIYTGNATDTVIVGAGVTTPVEVISRDGTVTWLKAGSKQTFSAHSNSGPTTGSGGDSSGGDSSNGNSGSSGSNTGTTGSGSGSSDPGTGSGSTGSGTGTSGSGTGTTGSSSGSTGSGTGTSGSGTGSTGSGTGTTGSGSGTSGSGTGTTGSGTGTSGSGTGTSGSGTGTTGSGTGTSGGGTGTTGSGTGTTGSGTGTSGSGAGSTGSGSGSTGTGTGTTTPPGSGSGTTSTPTNPSDPATPKAVITVTSPSTVLPGESVNVQAIASSFGDSTQIGSTIAWNFGDPSAAYNNLVGFNAAHAYANAGTYTITLTITTPDGHVGVATQKVTIAPDNRPTIYVSASGNDSNNGLSASAPIQSLARLSQLLASNTRVLFQDGGTYNMPVGNGINVGGMSHVYIGSYGSGAQPILMYTGPATQTAMISMSATTEGLVVQGLTFDSKYTNNKDSQAIASAFFPNGNDITIRGNTFLNVLDDMNLAAGPKNVLVQDNSSPDPTALNAYFSWTQGSEIVFLGNTVANSVGEAILRIGGATDVLIADNNFTNIAGAGGDTADIVKNVVSIQAGGDIYVYGNTLSTGPVEAGPLGTPAADPNASMSNVVFDSNIVLNSSILLTPGVHQVEARNNVIHGSGNAGFTISAQEVMGNFNWQVQDVYILNNTVTEPGVWGGLLSVNNGEAQGIHIDNNLFVDPSFVTGAGAGFIKTDEDDMNSFAEIKDNVWSVPASVASFAQGGYFFESSNVGSQAGWLTPAEWEATGIPKGDVYENVNLGATYSVNVDGFTAGSDLPNS